VRYIQALGVENIAEHAQGLIARTREALTPLGYSSLTPEGTQTPIVAFHVPDPEELIRRVKEANILVTVSTPEQRMRVSFSVFNTEEDVDRLVEALS
jgi:selenocysteine lyase/cysteine desulfurase